VSQFRIGYNLGGEHSVCVRCFRRHQAVGGEQNRRRYVVEFLLLILPCCTKIALQVGVLLQLRIAVSRKHFAVGVDVDSLSFSLLQQQLQVEEVVTADDDERTFFHIESHCFRSRSTVGRCVGPVQQLHAGEVDLAGFKNQREQSFHGVLSGDGGKSLIEEIVDLSVSVSQYQGVVGISCHAAQAEEDQGLEGTDVFISLPYQIHVVIC